MYKTTPSFLLSQAYSKDAGKNNKSKSSYGTWIGLILTILGACSLLTYSFLTFQEMMSGVNDYYNYYEVLRNENLN